MLKSRPRYRDRTSNLNNDTIYNWYRDRYWTTPQTTAPNTTNPLPQTIVCLGAKPTTGTGTQPTTPTGPISTTPTTTTTTPTTTAPVPESAAVTDNRNAQVVKATQANQAFSSAFMSGFAPVLQQPTKQQSANIDKANAVTNKPTVTLGTPKPNPFATSVAQSQTPTLPAQSSNPNPAIPAKIEQARKGRTATQGRSV